VPEPIMSESNAIHTLEHHRFKMKKYRISIPAIVTMEVAVPIDKTEDDARKYLDFTLGWIGPFDRTEDSEAIYKLKAAGIENTNVHLGSEKTIINILTTLEPQYDLTRRAKPWESSGKSPVPPVES
jgi:hypothetical protein